MRTPLENVRARILVVLWALSVWGVAGRLSAQAAEGSDSTLRIRFPDPRLEVNGLNWFGEDQPVLRRLPARLKETFRPPVWSLAQQPSGGRIRFSTDSTTVRLMAKNPDTSSMHHMTVIGQSGFDIYVNGRYLNSAWPDASGRIVKSWKVGGEREMREITLYLPLYKEVTVEEVALDKDAKVGRAVPFRVSAPVVYYGSSITQGGCAENPGLSYQAIVSRWLNLDFVNLGFSGNGLGEPAVAEALSEIQASCFVLDHWANPSVEVYRAAMPRFVEILRLKHARTPILVVGPYFFPAESVSKETKTSQDEKRRFARGFVEQRRRQGDRWISFVDGLDMISENEADGLVDGVHANSIGFRACAEGLEPHLRKALGIRGSLNRK